jgi:hypothetical protein
VFRRTRRGSSFFGRRSNNLDRILDHAVGHHCNQRNSVTESHYVFSVLAVPQRGAWQKWANHAEEIVGGRKEDTRMSSSSTL